MKKISLKTTELLKDVQKKSLAAHFKSKSLSQMKKRYYMGNLDPNQGTDKSINTFEIAAK